MGTALCIAIDDRDRSAIDELVRATTEHADLFKVGLTAFCQHGPELVTAIAAARPVFLDLKLHDIPAQVAGAVAAAAELKPSFLTVHASGGAEIVRAAVGASGPVVILAVTVITSLDDAGLVAMGIRDGARAQVLRLAEIALAAGAGGLVCSPQEVAALRERFGPAARGGPVLVVPGVRPPGSDQDDQRRTLSPEEAVEAGADVIVVGRPITRAADPGAAARAIAEGITA